MEYDGVFLLLLFHIFTVLPTRVQQQNLRGEDSGSGDGSGIVRSLFEFEFALECIGSRRFLPSSDPGCASGTRDRQRLSSLPLG